jgi:hypothetical protein
MNIFERSAKFAASALSASNSERLIKAGTEKTENLWHQLASLVVGNK